MHQAANYVRSVISLFYNFHLGLEARGGKGEAVAITPNQHFLFYSTYCIFSLSSYQTLTHIHRGPIPINVSLEPKILLS